MAEKNTSWPKVTNQSSRWRVPLWFLFFVFFLFWCLRGFCSDDSPQCLLLFVSLVDQCGTCWKRLLWSSGCPSRCQERWDVFSLSLSFTCLPHCLTFLKKMFFSSFRRHKASLPQVVRKTSSWCQQGKGCWRKIPRNCKRLRSFVRRGKEKGVWSVWWGRVERGRWLRKRRWWIWKSFRFFFPVRYL